MKHELSDATPIISDEITNRIVIIWYIYRRSGVFLNRDGEIGVYLRGPLDFDFPLHYLPDR